MPKMYLETTVQALRVYGCYERSGWSIRDARQSQLSILSGKRSIDNTQRGHLKQVSEERWVLSYFELGSK